jgi:hypothetical protein
MVLIAVVAVLVGCSQLPTPTPTPSITVPADWPQEVPLYDGGELTVAYVGPDGTASASWDVVGVPEKRVMGAYHKALHEAGFRTTDWFSDLAQTGYVYRGHGLVVRAGTIDTEESVSLFVDVGCVGECGDGPSP